MVIYIPALSSHRLCLIDADQLSPAAQSVARVLTEPGVKAISYEAKAPNLPPSSLVPGDMPPTVPERHLYTLPKVAHLPDAIQYVDQIAEELGALAKLDTLRPVR